AAALTIVRNRAHRSLRVEPFDASRAVRALARIVPEPGIRAAEAEHRVLGALERDVVDEDLEREQHDVRIEEEIKIDDAHVERERRAVAVRDHDLADVAAPIDPKARLAFAPRGVDADLRAVQEPLHERQERHELAVRALAEVLRVTLELLDELAPRVIALDRSERLPVPLKLAGLLLGNEQQRPEHGLTEMADEHWVRFHVAQRGELFLVRPGRLRA